MQWFRIFMMGCFVLALTPCVPAVSHAKFYIAGMGGFVAPSFTDRTVTHAGESRDVGELSLDNAAMGGGKFGYYFPQFNWLGVETEGYLTSPNHTGADRGLDVATWAFNAIVRYPGKRFQPYAGAGLGVFFVRDELGSEEDNWVPGVNALFGIRAFLTETQNIALFAEYKFNYVKVEFIDDRFFLGGFSETGTYSANIGAAGVSFHFDIAP